VLINHESLWSFIALAILVIVVPISLKIFGVRTNYFLRSVGIQNMWIYSYVFASAVCFFVAATMQFPFREEEGCGSASADTIYHI